MDFRILGPLQVLDEGHAVTLGGSKQRALLALFLVHANETLTTDRLVDELWGERPPVTPAKSVQMHVSRLRKALAAGAGGGLVVTRERGYELRIKPEQLDSLRFERLCAEGRNELAAGRPESAVEAIERGLALWHDAPLADLAYEAFAHGEVARLEELRAGALEQLVEAKLRLGRHAEVIVQLEGLIAEHPYRERLRAQLMLALYRCERQADALQAYQDARRQLVEDLGIEPGERLRELERKILAQEPELAPPVSAGPAAPVHPQPSSEPVAMPEGTVTVLFTDLVGSTELLERLGDDDAETLRREYFRVLRRAVTASRGRDVKNLGDGLMVVFGSTLDALNSAVAMQRAIDRRNRRTRDKELRVRIGVSVGEPTREGDDYFGMPVVVAKRFCDHAERGQILASELVRVLAGQRGDHTFLDHGRVPLKGLAEPVAAVEVLWEAPGEEDEGGLPLPPRIREISPMGFTGRVSERQRLAELFDAAREGDCRVALLSGEPGIGKTRLSVQVALEARQSDAAVLYGRSDEDLQAPHGPWIEALSHYVEHAPEDVLRDHIERHGGELARLVPALADRVSSVPRPRETEPDTQRYLLWGAVVGLLREASAAEPMVLVLDDLHWADKPSLLLLKHVVTHAHGMHALIVGTYRESELSHGHLPDALADLAREGGTDRLSLTGLDESEIAAIVESAGGHGLDQDGKRISADLLRETDGNPFYVVELLRHLLDSDAVLRHDDGSWIAQPDVVALGSPQSVREVIDRRVARLGRDVVEVLSVAAVIGQDFDTDLLLRIHNRSDDQLLQLLEEAVDAMVLVESAEVAGRFSFAHALINHTLYANLGTTRRARVHRRVAEALEELLGSSPGARVTELAYHWAKAAAPTARSKAAAYARLAGQHALSKLGPDEALRWFQQALALQDQEAPVPPAERCELLVGLGEAQRQVGEASFRGTLLEASGLANDLGDASLAAKAAIANNRGVASAFGDVDTDRLEALGRALELDRFTTPARCARLISLQAVELASDFDHERRRALAEEALALARHAGDPATLARVLQDYIFALTAPDTLQHRRELLPELLEQATLANDPALEFFAAGTRLHVSVEGGELDEAEQAAKRAREIAEEIRQPSLRWFSRYFESGLAQLRGDLVATERLAEEALQLGSEAGQPDAFLVYGGQLAAVRVEQGRAAELVALVEQTAEATPRMPVWRAALAHLYCVVGRTTEAAAIIERAVSDHFNHVPHDQSRLMMLAYYAIAASETAAKDAAAVLYELMEPWSDQVIWIAASGLGHVGRHVGSLAATLGWHELADQHFATASAFHERNGMLLWEAHGRLAWAEALASRGRQDAALTEVARALSLAREHGYVAIERRASALASAI
jgi:DNA-binding SARP family transcriptional activator